MPTSSEKPMQSIEQIPVAFLVEVLFFFPNGIELLPYVEAVICPSTGLTIRDILPAEGDEGREQSCATRSNKN